MAHLNEVARRAARGFGQVVAIAGEAGIGKSRMVEELKSQSLSERPRTLVLQGRCFETDYSVPYGPIVDLLYHAPGARAGDTHPAIVAAAASQLGPSAGYLARLVPELGAHLPAIQAAPAPDREEEKRQLFHAVWHLFRHLSATQPLLLVIEDLHWSDDLSLEFLLYMARQVFDHRVLLILTYRDDEVHQTLPGFLSKLAREPNFTRIDLPRLTRDEVGSMLAAIAQGVHGPESRAEVSAPLTDRIYSLTEGNPFFIEELVTSLIGSGGIEYRSEGNHIKWVLKPVGELRAPRSVEIAVQQRLEQLHPGVRQLLYVAAVAGRRFDFRLLSDLTRLDQEELLGCIKELVRARLVLEESEDVFAFRHALTRQAVYFSLLSRERRSLHRQVAENLEQRLEGTQVDTPEAHSEPVLSDLAYHFYEARDWRKALEYAYRAGEKAIALHAPRTAVEQFSRALEAARHLSLTPPARLYRARGLAYETLGDFERARADHEAMLRMARASGNMRVEWQALYDLGSLWASRDYAQTGHYSRSALELAQKLDDPTILAASLNRLGNWYMNVEQPEEGLHYHRKALEILQASGDQLADRRALAETFDLLSIATFMSGDLVQSMASFRQAIGLFRELGDLRGLAMSLGALSTPALTYLTQSMVPGATEDGEIEVGLEEAQRIARDIGWRAAEAHALFNLAFFEGSRGAYGKALRAARTSLEIAEEIAHSEWTAGARCALGCLYMDLLAPSRAQDQLEQALTVAREARSAWWTRMASGFLALSLIHGNQPARAQAVLDAALGPDVAVRTPVQRVCRSAYAELALARRDPEIALFIIEHLVGSATNLSEGQVIPYLWMLRGKALAMQKETARAEATLQEACEAASASGVSRLLWRIHLALGCLYHDLGRGRAARDAFSRSWEIVEQLAASVPDPDLRQTFLQNAGAQIPSGLSKRRMAKLEYNGLTARELEIASHIARGESNLKIARALVISERTVEVHVSNILSKLGFDSRSEIAVWAVEKGLA